MGNILCQPISRSADDNETNDRNAMKNLVGEHLQRYDENLPVHSRMNFSLDGESQKRTCISESFESDINEEKSKRIAPIQNKLNSLSEKKLRFLYDQLFEAAEVNDFDFIRKIFEEESFKSKLSPDIKCIDNITALHLAVLNGNYESVFALLKCGADVEAINDLSQTPLHFACLTGNLQIAKLLIEFGAQISSLDENLNTPWHYAAQFGYGKIINYFFECSKYISFKNKLGFNVADLSRDEEIFNIFVSREMSVSEGKSFEEIKKEREEKLKDESSPLQKLSQELKQRFELNYNKKIQINGEARDPNLFDYICEGILGQGTFGTVYSVIDKSGKKFALKALYKPGYSDIKNPDIEKYIRAERNVMKKVNHNFIAKLYHAFQTKTRLFLALEYVPNGNLRNMMDLKKMFNENDTRFYIAEILIAIEELHRKRIIYRDLKPDNVLIDENGHIKLVDFGLSCILNRDDIAYSVCGPKMYVSPEIIERSGYNVTLDWYLLGCLMYELLFGYPPFENNSKGMDKALNGKLNIPSKVNKNTADLLKKLLDPNPLTRIGSRNDSEDIKNHPFFKDVNWNHAQERKLKPPKVLEHRNNLTGTCTKYFYDIKCEEGSEGFFENWNF